MDLVNLETSHIPFKLSKMDPTDWTGVFRSWPSAIPGWRNWYRRMPVSKRTLWDENDISQCIEISLSNMTKNESLLVAASHLVMV